MKIQILLICKLEERRQPEDSREKHSHRQYKHQYTSNPNEPLNTFESTATTTQPLLHILLSSVITCRQYCLLLFNHTSLSHNQNKQLQCRQWQHKSSPSLSNLGPFFMIPIAMACLIVNWVSVGYTHFFLVWFFSRVRKWTNNKLEEWNFGI